MCPDVISEERSEDKLQSEIVDPPIPPYELWFMDMSAWNEPPGTPRVLVESRSDISSSAMLAM